MTVEQLSQLHFLRPEWLLMLPVCGVVLWMLWRRFNRNSQWEGQCDPALLKALLVGAGSGRQWIPLAGLGLIWLLAIVALAGPAWYQKPQPVFNKLQSRVLILDLSHSMDSADVSPSRLERARYKLTDLISHAGGTQQSLIVFAGDAFVVSPFTDDYNTLINLIPSLTSQTVPVQGSRADKALELARELIDNASVSRADIVILTDGVTPQSLEIATALAEAGHRLHVLAVGTSEGAPIQIKGGGLLKDAAGSIVIPRVDHNALKSLAAAGGGRYLPMRVDDSDINTLNDLDQLALSGDFSAAERTDLSTESWVDSGIWLLFPLLLISAFSFRRGWVICAVMLLQPGFQEAHAFGWKDLWLRSDQQATRALTNEEPSKVPENSSPAWRGSAAYRQQQHESAAELFGQLDSATAHYNRANALAKAGELGRALEAYEQALSIQSEMEDAKFNRDLVNELLNQQQQQNSQQQSNQDQAQDENSQQQEQREGGNGAGSQDEAENEAASGQRPENQTGQQAQDSEQRNAQQAGEGSQDDQQEQQSGSEQNAESGSSQTVADNDSQQMDESQQQLEQWLKQVPDDPGGLLRRKFRYQYSLRPQQSPEVQQW